MRLRLCTDQDGPARVIVKGSHCVSAETIRRHYRNIQSFAILGVSLRQGDLVRGVTGSMNNIPFRQIDLQAAAKQVMIENGFEPEFPPQVQQDLEQLNAQPPPVAPSSSIRDLRNLLWSSIDNETQYFHDANEHPGILQLPEEGDG